MENKINKVNMKECIWETWNGGTCWNAVLNQDLCVKHYEIKLNTIKDINYEKKPYLYEEKSVEELIILIEDKNIVINSLCETIRKLRKIDQRNKSKAGTNESKAGINESKAGINESKAGINESKAGINESKAGTNE
ncbi:MAG: hypothetical protein KFW07_00915 [Mycoplasmataceae bacterium]|nr:hypothetical protein [Mycoplasmataceae bacterium]